MNPPAERQPAHGPTTRPASLLSVVVPFHNAATTLPACLNALSSQTFHDVEFLFVDDRSSDGSSQLVEQWIRDCPDRNVRLLRTPVAGASAARNRGARAASGDWLVFTDADCVPCADWLADYARETAGPSCAAALAGRIEPSPSESLVARFLGAFTLQPHTDSRVHSAFTLVSGGFPTANLAIRRDVFEAVGGFDDDIPYAGEDFDLCDRIYKARHCIRALTCATVQHMHRRDLHGLVRQAHAYGRSHALLLRRADPGLVLLEAPGIRWARPSYSLRIWVDLNQADKKTLLLFLPALAWAPFSLLAVGYLAYLTATSYGRASRRVPSLRPRHAPAIALLLLLKSAALTAGRLRGSLRHRVLCL